MTCIGRKLFFAGIAALLASAAYGEKSVPTVTIKSPPAPPAKKTPGEPALRRLLTECPNLKDNTECQAVRDKIEYCVRRLHEASLQDYKTVVFGECKQLSDACLEPEDPGRGRLPSLCTQYNRAWARAVVRVYGGYYNPSAPHACPADRNKGVGYSDCEVMRETFLACQQEHRVYCELFKRSKPPPDAWFYGKPWE